MKTLLRVVSAGALFGTIAPPVLFVTNRMPLDQVHAAMLVATIVWFASASLWMED